ncbi:rhodanese-like domain-containing protein [Dokdonia sp. Hel_I_53]|uniref:rhodanese-like domain-containing protein n=1 Tax=Dokdonia sp. Hel_I_53 TaxID=1566287 RepID=UPI00119A59F5|nr:rhodanese-like domain-containing protein [Dokdonia sp. Hel_I_53]TVZ51892.1 rhodanese-related sulfurtransferase [Dokdonia sp. Hel_I_53]
MVDLTVNEWKEKVANDPNAIIVDVRTDEEIEEGMIENAQQIDIYGGQEFLDGIKSLEKSKNIYVYCRSGKRSVQACMLMEQEGFENTYNLLGGYMEWEKNA